MDEATGQVVFSMIDIDLPESNASPVRFTRCFEIKSRYIQEEVGELGGWNIVVTGRSGHVSAFNINVPRQRGSRGFMA